MVSTAVLFTLLPVRDHRERVVAYTVASAPAHDDPASHAPDAVERALLESITQLSRVAGKSLLVPVTPSIVREGVLTRFASIDAVWLLATDALDDSDTRRAMERLMGSGLHFAIFGFPDGVPLPSSLIGATIVLDAATTPPDIMDSRLRQLLESGLHPMVRNVDDRTTRARMMASGAPMTSGRLLPRGASSHVDPSLADSAHRALQMLAAYADGRPADASFDHYVHEDAHLGASLLRSIGSATLGVRGPRSVAHALNVLGRDAVMERLLAVTAHLIAEAANDAELAHIALRRAHMLVQLGSALDQAPHPRARALAGLLSVTDCALGPAVQLARQREWPPLLADALTNRQLPLGRLVDIIEAHDNGWWADVRSRCRQLNIAPQVVHDAWLSGWISARDELGVASMSS